MTAATLLAFAAGACGVLAVWEAAGALQGAALGAIVARFAAPLHAAPHRADDPAAAQERRRLMLVLAAAALGGGWIVGGLVAGLLAAVGAPVAAGRAIAWRRERWRAQVGESAPAAARAIADGLAAGRSIRGAIAEAAVLGGGSAAGDAELRAAGRALEIGEATDAVLERLRRRAASPAWDTLTAAILLQRDAGGDLAGLLRAIAADLEEARRVEADARAATAQARFTARIVAALPFGAALIGELAHPGTIAGLLSEPLPAAMAVAAVVLEGVALLAIRRLGRMGEAA